MVAAPPLLNVRDLTVEFDMRGHVASASSFRAVDSVSLTLAHGETLGLVGESGCGKTTLGRAILRLQAIVAGSVELSGEDIWTMSPERLRIARRKMQVVFQNPYASLNPRMTVFDTLAEPLRFHHGARASECVDRAASLMRQVGLDPAGMRRYPHEFSGGQRQRVAIARALAVEPELIIADEPVSSLDVSVQAQIINLLCELREQRPLAFLFISHDLAVVRHISHRVAVMRHGSIVECGPRKQIFSQPQHEYTRELLAAVPSVTG